MIAGMTSLQHDIADINRSPIGLAQIDWSDRSMPVLRQIRERFAIEWPFDGLRVAACMHVTGETANLMRTLRTGGAEVALAASNPLSTQDDTTAGMVAEYGVHVFARHGVDVETYYGHINSALDIEPHIVLDDGCDLVTMLHSKRTDLIPNIIGGCEETTAGVQRLRQMAVEGALRFPMVAVNDTSTKHMFDNRYGTGQSSLDAIMRSTNVLFAGATVVIAGYGYCGQGLAQRAAGLGAQVIVTEVDPIKALDATMQGFQVMKIFDAAKLGDVFITVTSNANVLTREHFEVMKDGAILTNAGHFDVEVDVKTLGEISTNKVRSVRPATDEYTLPSGKRLLVLAEGRLVNLVAADGHPASVMDMSFADQALTAEWLTTEAKKLEPAVHSVPDKIDRDVARLKLASMGIEIDTMTANQQKYVTSWQHGS